MSTDTTTGTAGPATGAGTTALDLLREEVAGWRAVVDGTSPMRFTEVRDRFIFVDHVGRIGVVLRGGFGGVEFVSTGPDLISVDIGPLALAHAGALLAGSDKVVVLYVIDYARARAESAQADVDRFEERLKSREQDAAAVRAAETARMVVALREEIATWRATAARVRTAPHGEQHIIVDALDRAMRFQPGAYDLEQVRPDLGGVSFMAQETALREVEQLGWPEMFLTVYDASEYADQKAERAQRSLNKLRFEQARGARDAEALDKQALRARDSEALAAAGGNSAQADRAQDARDDASLRARIVAAVVREMGLAAPQEGSKSRDELADRLFHAVSAHSLARVELLSEGLREALQEAYFQSENDAGAYGSAWRREIAINGKRGLADESDAALLERVVINVGHDYLVGADGIWLGDNEREFLAVMAQQSQVEIMRAAIVDELHDYPAETAEALGERFVSLGMDNPFEAILLEHQQRAGAAAPRP